MRRALLSVVVALVGGGAVTGVAWSVQTVGLPPPSRADRVAADATKWLSEHRVFIDIFHLDHERLKAICVNGWFPLRNGTTAQGSLLALQSGAEYLDAGGKVRSAYGFHRRAALPHLAVAVGCARSVERALVPVEQGLRHVRAERAYAAGEPAIALRYQVAAGKRFALYLAAGTYEPLVAILHAGNETITARLYLARLTPALLDRFDVPAGVSRHRP